MKKYITLAALLAAGTTFANAKTPTVVWDLDFESDGVAIKVADGVATNLASGVGSNGLISDGVITLNNNSFSFSQTAGNLSYADEFSLVVTVALGASQPGEWPAIFGLGETDAWCWKPSFYVATGTFNLDKDGFGGVVDETYKAAGNIGYTLPEEEYGNRVTISLVSNGAGKISLYVGGAEAGYTTITSAAEYGSNKLIKNFTFGARNGGGNKSNIQLYDATFYSGIVVPEPSAFGMLAGLGALALVASRRRRK